MDFTELMRLAGGHVEARLVQTAVELTIFDALEHSAVTAEALANRLKLEPKATELPFLPQLACSSFCWYT